MKTIVVDGARIDGWESFHDLSAEAFGFAPSYGRNLNAWVDSLTYLEEPRGLLGFRVDPGEPLAVVIENAERMRQTCPEQFAAFRDGIALVNWRRRELGLEPVIALAYDAG